MDFSIGAAQFNDHRMGFSALNQPQNSAPGGFSDILNRMNLSRITPEDMVNSRRGTPAEIDRTSELFQLTLELETFLVKNMLNSMRNTIQRSGLIDQGFAGKIYEDMLFDEYARIFTRNAGFGLAEQAYMQLRGW